MKVARKNYALLLFVLLAIYSLAILDYITVEKRSFGDAALETACTAVYVDCSGVARLETKAIRALVGLATMGALVLLVSAGMQRFLESEFGGKKRMARKIDGLKGHFIVCGYGALGRTFCGVLQENRQPFVVVDKDDAPIEAARGDGCLVLQGDALDFKTLEKAGVTRAQRLVAALESDSSNVFLSLTARELNPYLKIASRAFNKNAVSKLHQAGADYIVIPDVIGGTQLAHEVLGLKTDLHAKLISRSK